MPGPFYFAWVGGTIADPMTLVTVGDTTEGDLTVINISNVALATLTAGAQYNIVGNGIAALTTFIAPDPGATSIELDQAASTTQAGALLTIQGPRTQNEPFDPAVHERFDEDVLGFEIAQDEGDFATLTLDIKNNGIGLLATGRNLWCWLSMVGDPDTIPLFNGRLMGVPRRAADEILQLQFIARPDDFNIQKLNLSEGMKVLPFWDPVWLATQQNNPDTVLETYSALWHTDRLTLEVTFSDILEGEDGVWTVGEDQAFYDNFSMSFGDGAPLRQVTVSGTVSWEQTGSGTVDITGPLVSAFGAAGNPIRSPFSFASTNRFRANLTGGAIIYTFNGSSLKSGWPTPGTSIGGGWEVAPGVASDGKPLSYMLDAAAPAGFIEGMHLNLSYIGPPPPDQRADPTAPPAEGQTDFNVFINHGTWTYSFALNPYSIRMVVGYKASRKRTETVRAVMLADIMEVSDNTGSVSEEITYSSENVAEGIDPGGGIPIGSPTYRSYLQTDRGAASVEYLLLAARAKLRAAARAAEITFGVDFPTAIAISLRHSVALFDRRIPGGSAVGKVKQYRLTVGEGGMYGAFTIGCTVGNGSAATAATGIPCYVDAGYVDPGWQVMAGGQHMLLTDELAYQTLDQFEIVDDGLDIGHLTAQAVLNSCTVVNGYTEQATQLNKFQNVSMPVSGLSDPWSTMKHMATTVTLDLKPVTGAEYHTDFLPAVSLLAIPQTIDLRAEPG